MSWQDQLRELADRLTAGEITTGEYRQRSEELLAEADLEAAASTQPTTSVDPPRVGLEQGEQQKSEPPKVRIPKSAAWEAPSGEMTQIVGTDERTRVVNTSIADQLDGSGNPEE
jgi:hypothetical protein